ncbi:Uma2 family endonuclease [Spirulina sp. CS-785/01]|uniref:Uma2 family endonuclease n=1 Tax=Spirulina sp. CS-785/01 TaxID=3021716 RepID=UPI00232B8C42|nr:Uma2 family endonuclease [Spirulina sp. CS-785/01]MDB9313025.1 Uma2 family endonuclease [Spirulina sp. CS-785/01]
MTLLPTQTLSLQDFLQMPETEPASEYLDGQIIQKPMPQGKHSILQRELSFTLTATLRADQSAQAFPELRCTFGGRSLVPDITVFQRQRIPLENNGDIANEFNLPPDWTIKILSPHQSHTKVVRNILHCLDYGTAMGWLLDPDEYCIFVYHADKSVQLLDDVERIVPRPQFAQNVQLTVGEIFGWLKP